MICKKCGKYNPDYAQACMYCGGALATREELKQSGFYDSPTWKQTNQQQYKYGQSKTGVGVLLSLFLGILGLIIGLLLYPSGSYERETFISGWLKCFIVCIIIGVILGVVVCCGAVCSGVYR